MPVYGELNRAQKRRLPDWTWLAYYYQGEDWPIGSVFSGTNTLHYSSLIKKFIQKEYYELDINSQAIMVKIFKYHLPYVYLLHPEGERLSGVYRSEHFKLLKHESFSKFINPKMLALKARYYSLNNLKNHSFTLHEREKDIQKIIPVINEIQFTYCKEIILLRLSHTKKIKSQQDYRYILDSCKKGKQLNEIAEEMRVNKSVISTKMNRMFKKDNVIISMLDKIIFE